MEPAVPHIETTLQTLDRAVTALNVLRDARQPLALRTVAEAMRLPRPTARRILASLAKHEWVQQDEVSRMYSLGFGLLSYSEHLRSTDLIKITTSAATALRDARGETVTVQVRSGTDRVVVQEVEGLYPLRRRVAIGNTIPLYASASGRALLAFLRPHEVDEALDGEMQSRTPRSVVNPKAIRSQLAEIRATGVSVSEEQTELGVGAIATPVFNSTGGVVASIAISGPLVRWSSIYSAASVGALLAAALNASQLLGFKGELPWQHQLADGPARPGRTPEWFVGKDGVDGP